MTEWMKPQQPVPAPAGGMGQIPENWNPGAGKSAQRSRKKLLALAVGAATVAVAVGITVFTAVAFPVEGGGGSVSAAENGVITIGEDGAQVIEIFEDPICPYCAQLEYRDGEKLADMVAQGKLQIRYHLLNFLDRASGSGDYSTRAGGALQCVAGAGDAAAFTKFHSWLMNPMNQPKEDGRSPDHSNADLAEQASAAGVSEAAVACISSGENTEKSGKFAQLSIIDMQTAGAQGTPAVVVGGELVNALGDPSWLKKLGG